MPTKPQVIATLLGLAAVAPLRHQVLHTPMAIRADTVPDDAFEGAWRAAQIRLTRRDGAVLLVRPVTSLYVVTATHYSTAATLVESILRSFSPAARDSGAPVVATIWLMTH